MIFKISFYNGYTRYYDVIMILFFEERHEKIVCRRYKEFNIAKIAFCYTKTLEYRLQSKNPSKVSEGCRKKEREKR